MLRVLMRPLLSSVVILSATILACDGGFEAMTPGPTVTVPRTVEGLATALFDANDAVRFKAAHILAEMGPEAAPAVPALAQALAGPDSKMRHYAADALSEVGPAAVTALSEIIAALRSEQRDQEGPALIITLGNIGPQAKPAVPLLIDMLEYEKNAFTRSLIAETLGKIGDPEALPVLFRMLQVERDVIFDAREEAARAVGRFGGQARFVVPTLVKLLDDENHYLTGKSACAIAKITGESFPDSEGECSFISPKNGEARIVTAAREWWQKEGQFQDWESP
jgi:HEAT repeat protein